MASVFSPVKEMEADEYRRVTEVTYLGTVHGTLAALRRMAPRDRGVIVQVGSALAYRAIPLQSAYCAAKHAVAGFTESLRTELLHDGSRVHVTIGPPAGPQHAAVRLGQEPPAAPRAAGAADLPARGRGARRSSGPPATGGARCWVGGPTVRAILADRLAPGYADRQLGADRLRRAADGRARRPRAPPQPLAAASPATTAPTGASTTGPAAGAPSSGRRSTAAGWRWPAWAPRAWPRSPSQVARPREPPDDIVIEQRHDYLVRIRPRPDVRVVSQGRTVLATDPDGFFDGGAERGLFVHQTRMLSRYRWLVDGARPQPVALSSVAQHSWLGYYASLPPGHSAGPADQGSGHVEEASAHTLELRLSRYAGGGLHEDVDLTNFSQRPTAFVLTLELDADFADLEETRGERRQRGRIARAWREAGGGWELALDYRAERRPAATGEPGPRRIERGIRIGVRRSGSAPVHTRGRISFRVRLEPHGTWHTCLDYVPRVEGGEPLPSYDCGSFASTDNPHDRLRDRFLAESTGFATRESETLAPVVIGAVEQAKRDLASLRLHDLDRGGREWTMAAGVPIYLALFGRDTLTAAWQAALLGPEMMQGTLEVLARFQGRQTDDWRDEQPGRMLHESHTGPLAALDFHPRRRYYGSITTSGFYPVIVSELWHWTGDAELVRPFVRPALDALAWLDRDSDRDGDGFYEYLTRSRQGVTNQGWKDSSDAIVDEDGRLVLPPIATCEEQGFVYAAKLHLSEVLWWLGEKDEARRLYHEAGELKKRFNDRFWMEDEGTFAMGLDARGQPIRSAGSNPGHCVAAGIVDTDRAERTVRRLMAPDLFSGWGVRTLSSSHPAYNPYSYHRGSVWPVEHGSFALGFMRYGLHAPLEELCRGMFEAARLFDFFRLPEVFSGHARDADHPFPALYPQTNSPQAWSASTVFSLLQSMLGLYPYAPLNLLLLDPQLPAWLPEITLRNLRVGSAVATVRFSREGSGSTYEVLEKRGRLHVVRQPSPWSLTAGFAERLTDALSSLLP